MKRIDRVVYIGGLNNGTKSAEGVADAYTSGGYYADAAPFTFSQAINNPDEVRKAAKDARGLGFHSSGASSAGNKAEKWPAKTCFRTANSENVESRTNLNGDKTCPIGRTFYRFYLPVRILGS